MYRAVGWPDAAQSSIRRRGVDHTQALQRLSRLRRCPMRRVVRLRLLQSRTCPSRAVSQHKSMSDFGPLHQQAVVSQQPVKGESGSWNIQAPSAHCGLTVGAGCGHPVSRLAVLGLSLSADKVCPGTCCGYLNLAVGNIPLEYFRVFCCIRATPTRHHGLASMP